MPRGFQETTDVLLRHSILGCVFPDHGHLFLILQELTGRILFIVIFGPLIYTVDPTHIDVKARNAWPSLTHPMGTDNIGRDIFAAIMQGGRISLAVGIGVPLALFLMFERWFLVPLPKGPLEALLGFA